MTMMSSIWQRWTTTTNHNDSTQSQPEDYLDNPDFLDDCDNDESLPRQVQVGLSIGLSLDSSNRSETSSLSDFEEGMPQWTKDQTKDDRPHSPLLGFQIPVPQCIDNNSNSPQTLTQRSKCSQGVVPLLATRCDDDDDDDYDDDDCHKPLLQTKRTKWTRLMCAVMALTLMAVSVQTQNAWWEGDGRQDLPTFENRQAVPTLDATATSTSTSTNNNNQIRRSSLAFARASSELPVFGQANDDDELFPHISNSSPMVSFLGGCAFVAILLETGWKGYQKSKSNKRRSKQSQAVRRLYK